MIADSILQSLIESAEDPRLHERIKTIRTLLLLLRATGLADNKQSKTAERALEELEVMAGSANKLRRLRVLNSELEAQPWFAEWYALSDFAANLVIGRATIVQVEPIEIAKAPSVPTVVKHDRRSH